MNTICILGQTGTGKTELAELIARHLNGEIINMDMGQMYTKISIGTAKPPWKSSHIRNHLFDIIDEPVDYSVALYRKEVINIIKDIHQRGKAAIVVGGSLFYLKALLFDLHENNILHDTQEISANWDVLHTIDPQRAQEIHPNDVYRIKRALMIWYETEKKPSLQKPFWSPMTNNISLLWLDRQKDDLYNRIDMRLNDMVHKGWYEEVYNLPGSWQQFVHKKKLCGYNIVVDACKKNKTSLDNTDIQCIRKEVRAYAKKQRIFWQWLKKQCAAHVKTSMITELNLTFQPIDLYLEQMVINKGIMHE